MVPRQATSSSVPAIPRFESSVIAAIPAQPSGRWQRAVRWRALAAFALLGLYGTMAWTASLSKGLSFDEGLQLAVGYNIWVNDDYRLEGANGDLVKRWATLPYLISEPHFVGTDDAFWRKGVPYELAFRFFFEVGNRPESLLQQGRAMIALLGVATGLLVFWCARELFGFPGALVSLGTFAFSPHMLAFGGIVSTDMSIILTLLGCTWCIWRLLHHVTAARLLMSLGFFALLILAKPTALVIFPVTAILIAVKLIGGGALTLRWREKIWRVVSRRRLVMILAGLILLHAVAGWSAIWAHYGFRYTASPNLADSTLQIHHHTQPDQMPAPLARILRWVESTRFLPEGYRCGIESLLGNDDEIGSFMNGKWTAGGRPLFFPYTIWVKTQPVLFVLLALSGIAWWCAQRTAKHRPNIAARLDHAPPGSLYALTPFLALAACYVAIAATEDLNIGHRHILPIYPCLYVLSGAVGLAWRKQITWMKIAVALAMLWCVTDSVAMRPHYLAYFGPQAGGPDRGYRHLVDSSLDWGMNLPDLRKWLDQHDPHRREPLFLAYFGTDSPSYHGIESRRLPGFFDRREVEPYALTPGYYAISATLLQSVYTMAFGPWSKAYEARYQIALHNVLTFEKSISDPARRAEVLNVSHPGFWKDEFDIYDHLRFARLCAWLRHQGDPPHHVGHAILIWKLNLSDLQSALNGAPAELTDDPPPSRQFRRFHALRD